MEQKPRRRFGRASRTRGAEHLDQETADLRQTHAGVGRTTIAETPDRTRVQLFGTLKAVTLAPRGGTPALEAELVDGTGTVVLVWLGRRTIRGIGAGRSIAVTGRIGVQDGRRVMFNPRYELRP